MPINIALTYVFMLRKLFAIWRCLISAESEMGWTYKDTPNTCCKNIKHNEKYKDNISPNIPTSLFRISPEDFRRSAINHYADGWSGSFLLTGYGQRCACWLHTWRFPKRFTTGTYYLNIVDNFTFGIWNIQICQFNF